MIHKLKKILTADIRSSRPDEGLWLIQQRYLAFIIYAIVAFIQLTINLLGLSGPQELWALTMNGLYLILILLTVITYAAKVCSLERVFGILITLTHLFTCNEMLLCATYPSEYNLMLIAANVSLLLVNMMFSILAYTQHLPYILGAIGIGCYVASMVITGNEALESFCGIIILFFIFVPILGNLLISNFKRVIKLNDNLKQEEHAIIQVMDMEKEEVKTFAELASKQHSVKDTKNMLAKLSDTARQNVINNVTAAIRQKEMEENDLANIFPELTNSEIEICRLIIMNKALSEMCKILNKTESNITCQRSNIRKKLGLQPTDNLKKILQDRFEQAVGKEEVR